MIIRYFRDWLVSTRNRHRDWERLRSEVDNLQRESAALHRRVDELSAFWNPLFGKMDERLGMVEALSAAMPLSLGEAEIVRLLGERGVTPGYRLSGLCRDWHDDFIKSLKLRGLVETKVGRGYGLTDAGYEVFNSWYGDKQRS